MKCVRKGNNIRRVSDAHAKILTARTKGTKTWFYMSKELFKELMEDRANPYVVSVVQNMYGKLLDANGKDIPGEIIWANLQTGLVRKYVIDKKDGMPKLNMATREIETFEVTHDAPLEYIPMEKLYTPMKFTEEPCTAPSETPQSKRPILKTRQIAKLDVSPE